MAASHIATTSQGDAGVASIDAAPPVVGNDTTEIKHEHEHARGNERNESSLTDGLVNEGNDRQEGALLQSTIPELDYSAPPPRISQVDTLTSNNNAGCSSFNTAQEGQHQYSKNNSSSDNTYPSTDDNKNNAASASMARILEGIEDGTATTTTTTTAAGTGLHMHMRASLNEQGQEDEDSTRAMRQPDEADSTRHSRELPESSSDPSLFNSNDPVNGQALSSSPQPSSSSIIDRPSSSQDVSDDRRGGNGTDTSVSDPSVTLVTNQPTRPSRSPQSLMRTTQAAGKETRTGSPSQLQRDNQDGEHEMNRPDTTATSSSTPTVTLTPRLDIPAPLPSMSTTKTEESRAHSSSSFQQQQQQLYSTSSSSSSFQAKKSNASSRSSRSRGEIFKTPELPSPPLPQQLQQNGIPAPPTSNSVPNLQQQARYSHIPYSSKTHPPITAPSQQQPSQRSSAPVLAAIDLPPHAYSQSQSQQAQYLATTTTAGAGGRQPAHPDLVFTSSPVNIGLGTGGNDAGFGSSSPYPPIGPSASSTAGALQQRYSLPVQISSSSSSFNNNQNIIPAYNSSHFPIPTSSASPQTQPSNITTSLRPQPTMNYSSPNGRDKYHVGLPEMHPSALEARPSASAPFPPSSSPPRQSSRSLKKHASSSSQGQQQQLPQHSLLQQQVILATSTLDIAAPAAVQQRERPDASRPLGQEICLECLMRDRDMADVEVTGPGIWSRTSDIDFEEALRAEELAIANSTKNANNNGYSAYNGSSSVEDGPFAPGSGQGQGIGMNGNNSTDENYPTYINGKFTQNGQQNQGQAQMTSPSRESSVSDAGSKTGGASRRGRNGQYQNNQQQQHTGVMRRRIGAYDPLTSASLKLWTHIVGFRHKCALFGLNNFVNDAR